MNQAFDPPGITDPSALRSKVLQDAAGHVLARALHVGCELRLVEAFGGDTLTADEAALRTGANAPALYRLLHFLSRHGYFVELRDKMFKLTRLGALLRADAPDNTAAVIASLGHPGVWRAFGNLGEVLRTGLPPEQGRGRSLYGLPSSSADHQLLADSMIGYHAGEPQLVAAACDFSGSRLVVDVGGSSGRLLSAILTAHPHLRGIVFDRPGIEQRALALLAEAGLSERCTFAGGSFFDGTPAGADTYILSHILHDWGDAEASDILRACRGAMGPSARLLIVEALLEPDGDGEDVLPADMMLLANTQGRLRILPELADLLDGAGFALTAAIPMASTATLLEAHPAPVPPLDQGVPDTLVAPGKRR